MAQSSTGFHNAHIIQNNFSKRNLINEGPSKGEVNNAAYNSANWGGRSVDENTGVGQ